MVELNMLSSSVKLFLVSVRFWVKVLVSILVWKDRCLIWWLMDSSC